MRRRWRLLQVLLLLLVHDLHVQLLLPLVVVVVVVVVVVLLPLPLRRQGRIGFPAALRLKQFLGLQLINCCFVRSE